MEFLNHRESAMLARIVFEIDSRPDPAILQCA